MHPDRWIRARRTASRSESGVALRFEGNSFRALCAIHRGYTTQRFAREQNQDFRPAIPLWNHQRMHVSRAQGGDLLFIFSNPNQGRQRIRIQRGQNGG